MVCGVQEYFIVFFWEGVLVLIKLKIAVHSLFTRENESRPIQEKMI